MLMNKGWSTSKQSIKMSEIGKCKVRGMFSARFTVGRTHL